jgi:hypothetical protein
MTTPIDEERVGTVMREMLSTGAARAAPVDASELRSRARRRALRRVDRKVLIAVAAVAAVIVTLVAIGPLRSKNPPTHSPTATQPTTTTTPPTTTTPTTTTPPTTTTTALPVAAASQLDAYVADEAATDSAAASANGVTGHYGIAPFISVHSAPVDDDGRTVAVAAFSYEPRGHPVQVLTYAAGQWTVVAALPAPTESGSILPASVVNLTAGPVGVGDVTGDGQPDFVIMSSAADNVPGFVVSQAGGTWRYIPFSGPYATPPTDILFRSPQIQGDTIVSDYNDCVPDCASGTNSTIVWTYQPSTGEFTAPDPPGYR